MKLYLNKASPYGRLVLVVAHEKQLAKSIELAWTDPWVSGAELLAVTPYAKVPVLIAQDGKPLVESGCICDYLDEVGTGPVLLPKAGQERLTVLRKYGLGRALIDVAFGVVIEQRYHPSEPKPVLLERWRAAVERGIATLEQEAAPGPAPDMGDLAVAVALSYMDFRMSEVKWRASAPGLAAWFEGIGSRPSITATAPA
jgi:glutathione S-transferase